MWPVSTFNDPNHRTAFDQLISFCTTVNGAKYYFQRTDYKSPSELTPGIPAPNASTAASSYNWPVFNYLKAMASAPVPGFCTDLTTGNTFATKYATANSTGGTELDQILIESFDYIRCVNMTDASLSGTTNTFSPYNANTNNSSGEVVPTYDSYNDTKGFGRFETISQAALLFIGSGDSTNKQIIKSSGITSFTGTGGSPALSGTTNFTYGPNVSGTATRVQAVLLFEIFDPSQGYSGLYPGVQLKVTSSTLSWQYGNDPNTTGGTQPMFSIPSATGATVTCADPYATQSWSGWLGSMPMWRSYNGGLAPNTAKFLYTTVPGTFTAVKPYPDFINGSSITFYGGDVTVQTLSGTTVVQTITLTFPGGAFPVPSASPPKVIEHGGVTTGTYAWYSANNFSDPSSDYGCTGRFNNDINNNSISFGSTSTANGNYIVCGNDVMEGMQSTSGDLRLSAAQHTVASGNSLFGAHPRWGAAMAHGFTSNDGEPFYGATRGQLVKGVTSYWSTGGSQPLATPYPWNSIFGSTGQFTCEPGAFGTTTTPPSTTGVTAGSTTAWVSGQPPGDWDNGTGPTRDGPYINKADEGTLTPGSNASYIAYFSNNRGYSRPGPSYFSPARQMPSAVMLGSLPTGVIDNRPWQTLLFHPDPTGLHVGNAGMGGNGVALAGAPPDYLLLDLFTMPVVEPYAISEPLSTAGRINMNYFIVPFNYINRDTGVRAVLESQQMLAIPNTAAAGTGTASSAYKQQLSGSYNVSYASSGTKTLRFPINLDQTLLGFVNRFNTGDVFRSSTEICSLPLVPKDGTANATYAKCMTGAGGYWESHLLTGDNSRERPYANIYPLLTTKSNTFTVHFRVQTLKKAQTPGYSNATWTEGTDLITGEYRGSQTIERYIDPNDPLLPDCLDNQVAGPTASNMASYYKFRTVSIKEFAP